MYELLSTYASHMQALQLQFGHITCIHRLARKMGIIVKLGDYDMVTLGPPCLITFQRGRGCDPHLIMWQVAYMELTRINQTHKVNLSEDAIDLICREGASLLFCTGLKQPCVGCVLRQPQGLQGVA